MRRSHRLVPFVVIAAALPLLASCTRAPATSSVRLVAHDYGYAVEGTPTAGTVVLTLVNEGKELHHSQLLHLTGGKTLADLAQADLEHGPPAWARGLGGPNATEPGDSNVAYVDLDAGDYAVICFIPAADGQPHLAKGMVAGFTVAAAGADARATAPAPDATIRLKDFSFDLPDTLAAGRHTLLVVNDGPQPHELVLFRLDDGRTSDDFMGWVQAGFKGAPPAQGEGGTVGLEPGTSNTIVRELKPGRYVLLCFVPNSAGQGEPHVMLGMRREIVVRAS